jgi:uncharacterized HhH-GPD family protein
MAASTKKAGSFPITGDPDADALLVQDPLALVVGMLLDQQVPMEWAFRGPRTLKDRLGERWSAPAIAAMDPDDLVAVCAAKPAIHRFPAAMGRRIHELCTHLVEHHDGDAAKVWKGVRSGSQLFDRVSALPGFGTEKSQIFVALLAKRFGKAPAGWQEVAGPFADEQPRSVADVSSREAFAEVRAWKKAQKAAGKKKDE